MMMKKPLAAVLALTLGVSLSACSTGDDVESSASPSVSTTTASTEAMLASATAYTQRLAGVDAETPLFTVNGQDVNADYYLYWLTYDCYYWDYMSYMYTGTDLDFTSEVEEGVTTAQFLQNDARDLSAYYLVLEQQALANGCGLTEAQQAEWEQSKTDYIASNGQEAYDEMLTQTGVTSDTFERISTSNYLYQNLKETLIETPSQDDLDTYSEENEIYQAKHILICTAATQSDGSVLLSTGAAIYNSDGTPYEGTADDYNATALSRAQEILDLINEADPEQKESTFDQLMNNYSEDSGLSTNPNGYTFGTGEMVQAFEDGTKELGYGEVSGLVQSSWGYHIILRGRPDVEADFISNKMDAMVTQWLEEAEVVTNDTFDTIDAAAVYSNYKDYQTELSETANADSEANDTTDDEAGNSSDSES